MGDDGFFTFLARRGILGDEVRDLQQRGDIAGLHDAAEQARRDQRGAASEIAALQTQIGSLSRELAATRVALEVLGRVLVDSGAVAAAALDAQLAAAQARAESVRKDTSSALCSNCGLSFLGSQLVDTAAGALCKRCRAVAAP